MARVAGHTLLNEGAAFESHPDDRGRYRRVRWGSIGGPGFGVCSCGARSTGYDSANQRKAWHRDHKAEVAGR